MIDLLTGLALLALCVFGMQVRKEPAACDLLSAQDSGAWKGLFCIGILLHHFSSFLTQTGPLFYLFSHVGKTIVGGFFFLSGYGLMKVYGNKDLRPVFLLRRIAKLMIPFWLCWALYVVWSYLPFASGDGLQLRTALWSLIPVHSIVFGSWYIGATLFLYVLFYLAIRFGKKMKPALMFIAFAVVMILFSAFVLDEWSPFFFAFPLGMLVQTYEKGFLRFFNRFFFAALPVLLALVVGGGLLKLYGQRTDSAALLCLANLCMCMAFPLLVYGLSCRIRIGNGALRFLSRYSYEIYMLHYLAISILYTFIKPCDPILLLVLSVCLTLLFAVPVHWAGQKLLGLLPWEKKRSA